MMKRIWCKLFHWKTVVRQERFDREAELWPTIRCKSCNRLLTVQHGYGEPERYRQ